MCFGARHTDLGRVTRGSQALVEAGASPFAGVARGSPLALAMELTIMGAVQLFLGSVKCGQLTLGMLPLSAYPPGYEAVVSVK